VDATELTALIEQHARLIHKVAFAYCRNASDRADVVQEIHVQLWRSRHRYDELARFQRD
jgi:RNA polymerase sigma-70 factor (ECF subfamily)